MIQPAPKETIKPRQSRKKSLQKKKKVTEQKPSHRLKMTMKVPKKKRKKAQLKEEDAPWNNPDKPTIHEQGELRLKKFREASSKRMADEVERS